VVRLTFVTMLDEGSADSVFVRLICECHQVLQTQWRAERDAAPMAAGAVRL